MAIFPYQQKSISTPAGEVLSELSSFSLQSRGILTALGDFWTDYYRDLEPLQYAASGSVVSVSKEYTRLLDLVLSSNILDIPVDSSSQFELLVFDESDLENRTDHLFVAVPDLRETRYLTTSLFESPVILEQGIHFDVVPGKGYKFYVDLFNDKNIFSYAYAIEGLKSRKMLLWACDYALSSTVIYERYGRFLYKKAVDSTQYRWFVNALMHFYTETKTVKAIQSTINILYGVPYTRYADETVQAIYYTDERLNPMPSADESSYICIETDKATYYTYTFSTLGVSVGQTLPQYTMLATFSEVHDYISTPNWWESVDFPQGIFVATEGDVSLTKDQRDKLMDKVLKYNVLYIKLGVSYETYETYLAQINEIYDIIESGIPVYLYPFVQAVFKVAFADKVDMEEDSRMTAHLSLNTYHSFGSLNFDGTHSYYCWPDQDHGKDAVPHPLVFDGSSNYDDTDDTLHRHQPWFDNAEDFDGDLDYDAVATICHNNAPDPMTITTMGLRLDDVYDWDNATSEKLLHRYDGKVTPDGEFVFGYFNGPSSNELMEMHIRAQNLVDSVNTPEDLFRIFTRVLPFADRYSDRVFDGTFSYTGIAFGTPSGMSDSFTLRIHPR